MKTLKEWVKLKLNNDLTKLFDDNLEYPVPFNDATMRARISSAMLDNFGQLLMDVVIDDLETVDEIVIHVHHNLWMHDYELGMINRLIDLKEIDPDVAYKREVRTYGEDEQTYGAQTTTTNIGARSNTDNLGATHGVNTSKETAYDTVTGKLTNENTIDTNAVINSRTQAAATDSVSAGQHVDTRSEHTDTIETYTNVDTDQVPDYAARLLAIYNRPALMMLCKILAQILTIPVYGG